MTRVLLSSTPTADGAHHLHHHLITRVLWVVYRHTHESATEARGSHCYPILGLVTSTLLLRITPGAAVQAASLLNDSQESCTVANIGISTASGMSSIKLQLGKRGHPHRKRCSIIGQGVDCLATALTATLAAIRAAITRAFGSAAARLDRATSSTFAVCSATLGTGCARGLCRRRVRRHGWRIGRAHRRVATCGSGLFSGGRCRRWGAGFGHGGLPRQAEALECALHCAEGLNVTSAIGVMLRDELLVRGANLLTGRARA
mmetsp:Transcript_38956/g.102686  ORF Transcript_38956/g.102686 Transcript_38956/m.102686 type:complete len:260 (-) Transcript_38956:901-1680(-)